MVFDIILLYIYRERVKVFPLEPNTCAFVEMYTWSRCAYCHSNDN